MTEEPTPRRVKKDIDLDKVGKIASRAMAGVMFLCAAAIIIALTAVVVAAILKHV